MLVLRQKAKDVLRLPMKKLPVSENAKEKPQMYH